MAEEEVLRASVWLWSQQDHKQKQFSRTLISQCFCTAPTAGQHKGRSDIPHFAIRAAAGENAENADSRSVHANSKVGSKKSAIWKCGKHGKCGPKARKYGPLMALQWLALGVVHAWVHTEGVIQEHESQRALRRDLQLCHSLNEFLMHIHSSFTQLFVWRSFVFAC